ncbi:hypothetical protein [uncultured Winogradskyella sp.]|uniref:hypothetical protein n=1 Tax=Winogradskyella sp. 4-2091 TaxID=3381659 RepID=UPI002605DCC0|nr:hypothetical protein [uncultured Winogradskyella sp.]
MKESQKILTEISTVTRDIEDNYPELQKHLDETRSTLPQGSNNSASINDTDLKNYLNELKTIRDKYIEEH